MIRDGSSVTSWVRRRGWSRAGRRVAAVCATISLGLIMAACGGGPPSGDSGSSSNAGRPTNSQSANSQAVAFSHCMRSNGVPNYPDPNSTNAPAGGIPKVTAQQLGVSPSQFQTAETACEHFLPQGGQTPEAESQQFLSKMLQFAQCMRFHQVYNWPDPTAVGPQAPPGSPPYSFDLHGLEGLDGRSFSPQITGALNQCQRLTHLNVPWGG
jgi:hypothetical protein